MLLLTVVVVFCWPLSAGADVERSLESELLGAEQPSGSGSNDGLNSVDREAPTVGARPFADQLTINVVDWVKETGSDDTGVGKVTNTRIPAHQRKVPEKQPDIVVVHEDNQMYPNDLSGQPSGPCFFCSEKF